MEETHTISRRGLIGAAAATGAAATAAGALGPWTTQAPAQSGRDELLVPRQNIGIQLYTIRDLADEDLPGTLRLLADINYPEIELFSLHGLSASRFRELTDDLGLRAIGAHVGVNRWREDLNGVLTEAETLGMQYVGLPGIFPNPEPTLANYRRLVREMNEWGRAAADRGLRFYYHNHAFEFETVEDGQTVIYDLMLEETDPDLVFFELDLYWIVTAGRDPLDYLALYDQSRWPLFHVKDRAPDGNFADLGEGAINFSRIFRVLENKHYHHYIVERDEQVDPPRTAQVGYDYLRDLRGRRRGSAAAKRARRRTSSAR
jgi:sugar phosphate isomerase/epimerase